jgi:actin-like ATPase involved in cell morphogenesis
MTEKEKAEEMYKYAAKLHGLDKAKEESLKSAKATHALAPCRDGRMLAKSYWEKVIEHLNKKVL